MYDPWLGSPMGHPFLKSHFVTLYLTIELVTVYPNSWAVLLIKVGNTFDPLKPPTFKSVKDY